MFTTSQGLHLSLGQTVIYANAPARVIAILETGEFAEGVNPSDWAGLPRCGFLLQFEGGGLLHLEAGDEDLYESRIFS